MRYLLALNRLCHVFDDIFTLRKALEALAEIKRLVA
jgi:hypothetical protein